MRKTNLEVLAEIIDGDVALVVAVQLLEARHVGVDLVLGEVDGHISRFDAEVQAHLTLQKQASTIQLLLGVYRKST